MIASSNTADSQQPPDGYGQTHTEPPDGFDSWVEYMEYVSMMATAEAAGSSDAGGSHLPG